MMRAWGRVFLFLLAFQLEVRVKASASASNSDHLVQNPESCWVDNKNNCQFKIRHKAFHVNSEKLELHAEAGTILERIEPRHWRFIEGQVWVEKANNVSFETLFGSLRATHGEYWIQTQNDERILIKNISSDIEVTLRDGRSLRPPAGFQMWIGGINSRAESQYGMIEPIDLKKHLLSWYPLFAGSREEFTAAASDLKNNWSHLVETSSEIYKTQTLRKLAAIDSEKNAIRDRQRRLEEERKRIRELFRSRTFDR